MNVSKKLIIGFFTAILIFLSLVVSKDVSASTVTVSAGPGGAIYDQYGNSLTPAWSIWLNQGVTKSFTITPDTGYAIFSVTGCGGILSGNTYTIGPLSADCSVYASFTPVFNITASAGTGGTISPSGVVTVNYGAQQTFTVAANTGYTYTSVTGCGGTLFTNIFTTGQITANCAVTATFTPIQYSYNTYVSSGGGTIYPSGGQAAYGAILSLIVTPATGYTISSVTGCGGILSGNTYTIGPVTANCSVYAQFTPLYNITASAGQGGNIYPSGSVTVNTGGTQAFTVTPNSGYTISSVTGCGGTLSGSTYTTGPITAQCVVTASFAQTPYTVTASAGTGGTISPSGTVTVTSGATQAFTVTANTGYTIASVTGCSGTLSGSTYTTGSITANCTVTATFTANVASCTASSAAVSPSSIAQTTTVGTNPAATSITIKDNCGNSLAYAVNSLSYSSGSEWITTPLVGYTGTGTMTVSFNSTALTAGNYSAVIKVTPAGFSEITIPVTVTINSSANATGSTTSYTVTASAGTGGTISPSAVTVNSGATQAFTITPNAGYNLSSVTGCGGTSSGNSYTTGTISSNCTVTATFAANAASCTATSAIASPSSIAQTTTLGTNFNDVSITFKDNCGNYLSYTYSDLNMNWPSGAWMVTIRSQTSLTVSWDNSADLPTGTYTGSLIATPTGFAPITIPITLTVNSVTGTTAYYTVTASAGTGGEIYPSGTAQLPSGDSQMFYAVPNTGYEIDSVTGCGITVGSLVDGYSDIKSYYSQPITADCTVTATFKPTSTASSTGTTSYTVIASAGTGGTISPSGSITANSGATQAFTVAANTGYTIASVTGCSGTLAGSAYTTGAITANCTVTATFTPASTTAYSITASSGTGGTISPTGEVKVNSGATKAFTITPDAGYNIVSVTGCGGTLADNIYTTGVINSDCMVTATLSKTLGKDNCIAVLYKQNGDYYISSQILNYKDISAKTHYYWADFAYVPTTDGELWFKLRFAGELTDITSYSACQPALLSSDLNLYMPKLIIDDISYWIDIKYVPGTSSDLMFKLLLYGLN